MSEHDEAMLDDVALLALGVLAPVDATRIAAHVRTCTLCRAEYASLRVAADAVGYVAEDTGDVPQDVAARRKARLMDAIRTEPVERAVRRPPGVSELRVRQPWYQYAALAAALALAVGASLESAALHSANERSRERVAALERESSGQRSAAAAAAARARVLDARLAALLAPGAKHYAIPGGEVVTRGSRVIIALRQLAPLPAGKVYQAWTLARGAKAVAPSVTFTPDASGLAFVEVPPGAGVLAAVAVTVEPRGGSRTPTSKPAFVRPLS